MGSSDSGHYYSYVKHSNKWIEFNDTSVRYAEVDDVMSEVHGGE
jgi:ubiquitin C-terminal hydrolase